MQVLRTVNTYSLENMEHWRSPHYAVTHVRNKYGNIQGRSPKMIKVIFNAIKNCSKRK